MNRGSVRDILWVLPVAYSLGPLLQQRQVFGQRVRMLRRIEQARGTRVIAMIHRQESVAILGIPVANPIDIRDRAGEPARSMTSRTPSRCCGPSA